MHLKSGEYGSLFWSKKQDSYRYNSFYVPSVELNYSTSLYKHFRSTLTRELPIDTRAVNYLLL